MKAARGSARFPEIFFIWLRFSSQISSRNTSSLSFSASILPLFWWFASVPKCFIANLPSVHNKFFPFLHLSAWFFYLFIYFLLIYLTDFLTQSFHPGAVMSKICERTSSAWDGSMKNTRDCGGTNYHCASVYARKERGSGREEWRKEGFASLLGCD